MKRILFTLSLLVFAGTMALNAQTSESSSKACCKKSSAMVDSKTEAAAAELASTDESIEKRVCEKSGTVCYVRKVSSDDASAEAQFVPVTYNSETGKFEDKPKSAECAGKDKDKACCAKMSSASSKSGAKDSNSQDLKPAKDTREN